MSIYAYALLIPIASELVLPLGMERNTELVYSSGLAAIVEPEISVEALQATDERLLQSVLTHDRVIRELFQQTPLLPLRFGSGFTSQETLLNHLEKHQQQYLETLTHLRNKVEYTLKATPCNLLDESDTIDARGKAYLLAKKQRYQTQQAFQAQQSEQWELLNQLILKTYTNVICETRQPDVRQIHFLAQRNNSTVSTEQFSLWQVQCSHWQLSLSEALPPYHFLQNRLI
ncbi:MULTISPECIES: GvpL/GvpF family gas vesicle protein [Nostoc]|uniref:GvpL/GvpF family gas vesicle protein n=1 Tax=Nostoc paludosum FACHB-159 TaxID=2692908 RepID=A0ABR8JZV3_9NOSO|nr:MULTISPECIES: GvpL/GvpF family gas vesicle protein [Nostoc]MBD2676086.1 GvpL/GvpF family gas vesicle protein [Nostoc sp. FACHB-857]MBD2732784.1 GvpL/GvpF family gas vesicle protein [Nostoc paludosum FACHB-159]